MGGDGGDGANGLVAGGGGGGFGNSADGGDAIAGSAGTSGGAGNFTGGAQGGNGGSGVAGSAAGGGGGAGSPNAGFNSSGGGGGVGGNNGTSAEGGDGGFGGGGGAGGFGGGTGDSSPNGAGGGAGMGGAVFVQDGGQLTIEGGNIGGGNVAGGTGFRSGSAFGSGMFLQGSGTVTFQPSAGQTQTISDVIADEAGVIAAGYTPPAGWTAGSWSLTKQGAGALVLSGDNSYSGGTTVLGGTLRLGSDHAAGTGAITTLGTVIDYANGLTIANPIILNSSHTQLQVLAGTATQAGDMSEVGSRPLEKIGAGKLVLSGVNTYSGGTTINAGTVEITNGAALGTGDVTLDGGTLRGAPVSPINTIALANDIFVGGTSGIAAATGTTLELQGFFDVDTLGPGAVVTFGSASDRGTIEFDTAGVGASNTATYLIAGGTVKDSSFGDLGGLLGNGAGTEIAAGATVDLSHSFLPAIRNLTGAGNVIIGPDPVPGFPFFVVGIDPGLTKEFSGVISGPGSIEILASPFGPPGLSSRVILSGNNTYAGDTYICDCTELQIAMAARPARSAAATSSTAAP
jgi:autotransporter-associated beta strand protein